MESRIAAVAAWDEVGCGKPCPWPRRPQPPMVLEAGATYDYFLWLIRRRPRQQQEVVDLVS